MSEPILHADAADDARAEFPVKLIERVSARFIERVKAMAQRLNLQPLHLLAIMSFESGFSPSVRHRTSGATGLIQFLPSTAEGLGTTTAELARMIAEDQLEFVEKYFAQFRRKFDTHNTLEDAYMAVLFPAAIGKGGGHVLFRQGTRAYAQNRGLDVNRDGAVTVAEAASKVRARILA
ncbi:MAG TPA: transglycosylase SLT domain-containing protein [Longimicrobium sp.]|nr:transglycosylase SLT domain-containing protein [Longimicrobium sp.]